jgi:hypothetical protein
MFITLPMLAKRVILICGYGRKGPEEHVVDARVLQSHVLEKKLLST